MFMNNTYASEHVGYLEKYISTGEKNVIGAAGRNLPGKKRNGTAVALSIKVEEQFINEER